MSWHMRLVHCPARFGAQLFHWTSNPGPEGNLINIKTNKNFGQVQMQQALLIVGIVAVVSQYGTNMDKPHASL